MRLLVFGIVIVVVFTVFVTAFAAVAEPKSVRNLPKALWVLLCLFVPPLGGILYLTLGRPLPAQPHSDDAGYLRRMADRLKERGEHDR